mgnify:CR=1 FL=1
MKPERFRCSEYFRGRSWWISLPLPGRTWSWQVSTRDWGKLFLEHQQQVIELFKQHILLYGKGGELLFLEDVRRYFSNYVAPGSTTCRMLRETLLSVLQKAGSTADNRFETLSNGRRMYLGHLIPDDAPLRPDAAAVWDDVRKKWGH